MSNEMQRLLKNAKNATGPVLDALYCTMDALARSEEGVERTLAALKQARSDFRSAAEDMDEAIENFHAAQREKPERNAEIYRKVELPALELQESIARGEGPTAKRVGESWVWMAGEASVTDHILAPLNTLKKRGVAKLSFSSDNANIELAMTEDQRELARHALGLGGKSKVSYRNHFVTGPGASDHPHWMQMVEAGLAWRREGSELSGGDDLFGLTLKGAQAALKPGEHLCFEDFPNQYD